MNEFLEPSNADLLRELLLVVFGVLFRYFEKRKMKKNNE